MSIENINRIKVVYNAIGDLRETVVFVGGATVSFYADRMAPEVRPTEDVDVLFEIISRGDYIELEQKLRNKGFKNDTSSKFVGRYILDEIIVDVMATNEQILGFTNKWYDEGFKTAIDYKIDEQTTVKIFTPPYFIASKIEAFRNRGKNNGRMSRDFEDIVFVLENRTSIWEEMKTAELNLNEYLLKEFSNLQKNPYIEEWIDSNSDSYSPPASYYIMQDLQQFITRE